MDNLTQYMLMAATCRLNKTTMHWKLRPHTINVITTPVLTTTLITILIIILNITTPDTIHTITRGLWTIPADEYCDSKTTSISTPFLPLVEFNQLFSSRHNLLPLMTKSDHVNPFFTAYYRKL